MGLREPTGKPVEGHLVGVIPTKTSGLGKGEASISQEGTVTENNHAASLIGSCFNSSSIGLRFIRGVYNSTLGRKIVSM